MSISKHFTLKFDSHIHLQCAHVYEHAFMMELYDYMRKNGFEFIEFYGSIWASTDSERITLWYYANTDNSRGVKFAELLDEFILGGRNIPDNEIELRCNEVECECGRIFHDGFVDTVRENWQYLNAQPFVEVSGVVFDKLNENYSFGSVSTFKPEAFEYFAMAYSIFNPTVAERIAFYFLSSPLISKTKAVMRRYGVYRSGVDDNVQREDYDQEIYITKVMICRKDKDLGEFMADLRAIPSQLNADNIVREMQELTLVGSAYDRQELYKSYGVLVDEKSIKEALTAENIRSAISKIKVSELVHETATESDFYCLLQDEEKQR